MGDQPDTDFMATAVEAARAGGALALRLLGQPGYIKQKGPRDVVTGSVLEIEARIREIIQNDFPEHHLITEEQQPESDSDAEVQWIVDPIDGTANYYRRFPAFAVSIAVRRRSRMLLGVVYDPMHDELFQARRGQGAYLNDKRLHVTSKSEAYEAFIGTDWPNAPRDREDGLRAAAIVIDEALSLRTLGAPALGLCYVAAGYLDMYFHLALSLWDIAAAAVILEEAGGRLTDLQGGAWIHSPGHYLATNGHIHSNMLKTFLGFWRIKAITEKGVSE
jgi:myo-inositol-1(or 4)-monophosphatase